MAYEIPFTDFINKGTITVEDNSINTDTSLKFAGRRVQDYGTSLHTNFLQLMENFANVNPPSNPVEGQLWYDTTTGIEQLKIYDGTSWVAAGGLKKSSAEPDVTNSVIGDLWVDTTNSQLYLYSGSGWILVGPTYSNGVKTGAIPETIIDRNNVSQIVIVNYVNNVPVSILSTVEFTPKTPISGFTNIKVGITPSSTSKFNGTADKADNLVVGGSTVASSNFMRKDETSITNFPIVISNNGGLSIGSATGLRLLTESGGAIIEQPITGQSIDMRVNNSGTTATVLRVSSLKYVGINNLSPDEALDVTGNIKSSGTLEVNDTTESTSPSTGSAIFKGGVGVASNLHVGGNIDLSNATTGTIFTKNIRPDVANVRNIGSGLFPYDNLWANRITGNLTGNVTGNVTGSAGSAAKLNTPTTFQMSGDMSSSGFVFDGQVGGSTKTFVTSIDPTFISTKPSITTASPATVQSTDELILSRSGVLYRATQNQFINSISTFQPGMVMMWGGLTVPTGWFICNGAEVLLSTYSALATALGYDALDNTTWYFGTPSNPSTLFKIPDYRGRFPAGLGLPGGGNRITDPAINVMGGVSGDDEVTISVSNLPEHQHDLKSVSGGQFYATTTATETGVDVTAGSGDTAGTGTRLSNSGGIDGGAPNNPLDITNPFLAINFIIYHGVV